MRWITPMGNRCWGFGLKPKQRFFLRVKRGIRSELVARRVWLLQFVLRRLFVCYTICWGVEVNEVPVVEMLSEGVPVQGEEIWVCGPEVLELEAVVNASAGSTQHFMAESGHFQ